MAQDIKDHRIIIKGEKARKELEQGARFIYEPVMTSFGPKGRNVLIEKPFGRPLPTRDGVTIAREVYSKDRSKNMGAQLLLEASETTNRVAGDGTTATIGLTYHLVKNGMQLIASGKNPMEVKDILIQDSEILLDRLEKLAKPVKKYQLKQVATVSSGDPLLGELIAGAVEYVGKNGGIMTERASLPDVEREYMDGYYLQSGFQAIPTGKKEMNDPIVLVCEKRITAAAEIADLLTKTLTVLKHSAQDGQIPRFLIIGNIEDTAYFNLIDLINKGKIDCIIVKTPPQFGEMGREVLADIATYAQCKVITESVNIQRSFAQKFGASGKLQSPYIGTINRVVANHNETTLFSDYNGEDLQIRIQTLKDQLESEPSDHVAEKIRQRIGMLEGKIAMFRIGGATDSEKEEKEFRIEDSINATRAAERYGVVPGGAITLLELSKCNISQTYKQALRSVFERLLKNAALPSELKLDEALKAPYGQGFNLRESNELVDMVKAGILDPVLVVKEVVRNATAQAHLILTMGNLVIFEDSEK